MILKIRGQQCGGEKNWRSIIITKTFSNCEIYTQFYRADGKKNKCRSIATLCLEVNEKLILRNEKKI